MLCLVWLVWSFLFSLGIIAPLDSIVRGNWAWVRSGPGSLGISLGNVEMIAYLFLGRCAAYFLAQVIGP